MPYSMRSLNKKRMNDFSVRLFHKSRTWHNKLTEVLGVGV